MHVGCMFLMLATAAATKVSVDVNITVTMAGQEIVCKTDLKTDIDGRRLEPCDKCPTQLPNGTWLTYEPKTSLTPSTTPMEQKKNNHRIPTDLFPLHYDLELFPNMSDPNPENFSFTGKVKIRLQCRKPTDTLTLHVKDLDIAAGTVKFSGNEKWHTIDTDKEFLLVHLDAKTTINYTYFVEITFKAPLKNNLVGLYYSKYIRSGKPVYLATTHMQPSHARKVFPCFDEPAIKATFQLTLVRPMDYISLSNMPLDSTHPAKYGNVKYEKDTFKKTEQMSTYLLALVICDFVNVQQTTENGVLFRVWSRADVLNQTKYSFDTGLKSLSYFEKFFSSKYPLPKLDMVAIPEFAADGMENWGLILLRESSMVTMKKEAYLVSLLVNHEIAHQWFGDLVSPAWWDATWLNEGFSSFAHSLGMEYCHPEWKVMENFPRVNHYEAFSKDDLVSSHPIFIPDIHPSDLLMDAITYYKAAAVIRMMRHFLGFETFAKGLSAYLKKYQYSAATQDDLWSALTQQAKLDNKKIDVKEVMDTWLVQMNFPLVTVTRDNTGFSYRGALRVSQKRYLLNPNAAEIGRYVSPFNYTWNIPLTFASNKTRNFNESIIPIYWLWRNETSKVINASELLPSRNTWFICNINMNGYYRVNYDISNWMALAKQLKEDHEAIPIVNRIQIISDACDLAKANLLPYDTVFGIMDYLENERHDQAWKEAIRVLTSIGLRLSSRPIYGEFKKFLKKKIMVLYEKLEEKKKTSNLSESEESIRDLLSAQACSCGFTDCAEDYVAQYKRWMENPKNNTIQDTAVYCRAISKGGEKEWNFLLQMYIDNKVTVKVAQNNLGCTKEPWLLNRYLQMSIETNSPFAMDVAVNIPQKTTWSAVGRLVTWDFFKANFKKLNELHGTSYYWIFVIDAITQDLDTESQLNELKAFKLQHHGTFGPGELPIQQAIQNVEFNVQWMKSHYNTISDWLKANVN